MTSNQIKYNELLEQRRANLRNEELTHWYNTNKVRQGDEANRETERYHRETISLDSAKHAEQARHNLATERETQRYNTISLNETHRSNVARENETKRANLAKESENYRSNVAREQETHRSNIMNEALKHEGNVISLQGNQAALMQARAALQNADTRILEQQETQRANKVKEDQRYIDYSHQASVLRETNRHNREQEAIDREKATASQVGAIGQLGRGVSQIINLFRR